MRWPNKIKLEGKNDNGYQCLIVTILGTKEVEDKKKAEKIEKEKQELKQAVGLSLVLRKIADSVSFAKVS